MRSVNKNNKTAAVTTKEVVLKVLLDSIVENNVTTSVVSKLTAKALASLDKLMGDVYTGEPAGVNVFSKYVTILYNGKALPSDKTAMSWVMNPRLAISIVMLAAIYKEDSYDMFVAISDKLSKLNIPTVIIPDEIFEFLSKEFAEGIKTKTVTETAVAEVVAIATEETKKATTSSSSSSCSSGSSSCDLEWWQLLLMGVGVGAIAYVGYCAGKTLLGYNQSDVRITSDNFHTGWGQW